MKVFVGWSEEDVQEFRRRANACGMNLSDKELAKAVENRHKPHRPASFFDCEWDVLREYEESDRQERDLWYYNFFGDDPEHSEEQLKAMETSRLFAELDDVVQSIAMESNEQWSFRNTEAKKAYNRILHELKRRVWHEITHGHDSV